MLLAATLGFAIVRPRGLPEVLVAGPAALLLLATGVVSWGEARSQMADLGPTIGFLAAILVVGARCEADGLFRAAGERAATLARGSAVRLLAIVFVLASAVTAVLSLDATVVFVTPVAFATASALALRAKPHVYSCVHLANSASILLPVSNLTNLLAFQATGLSFPRFGALMALPWVAAIGVEWAVIRRFFARELSGSGRVRPERVRAPLPRWSLIVLALTLAGFLASSALGVACRSAAMIFAAPR